MLKTKRTKKARAELEDDLALEDSREPRPHRGELLSSVVGAVCAFPEVLGDRSTLTRIRWRKSGAWQEVALVAKPSTDIAKSLAALTPGTRVIALGKTEAQKTPAGVHYFRCSHLIPCAQCAAPLALPN